MGAREGTTVGDVPPSSRQTPSPSGPPTASTGPLPSAAVFDIDGVLADVRHRLHHVASRPKDWDAFFGAAPRDPALPQGQAAVAAAAAAGHIVVYLTGRPERCRTATVHWLALNSLPAGPLHMRRDSDRRPARITKVAALRRLAGGMRIAAFIDDDPAVVEAVRRAGFPAVHASWMDRDATAQALRAVLCEIQEVEGRT